MPFIKRITEVEQNGDSNIVTVSMSCFGNKETAKYLARVRAAARSGVNIPHLIENPRNVTEIVSSDLTVDTAPDVVADTGTGNVTGTIKVRVNSVR